MVTKLKISPVWFLLFILFFISDMTGVFLMALLAALAHEGGHAMALFAMGRPADEFRLSGAGISMKSREGKYTSYPMDMIAALSGPLVNLMLALLAGVLWKKGIYPEVSSYFAGINLILMCLNLLPVKFLDGGRALYAFMAMLFDLEVCDFAIDFLSWLSALTLLIAGLAVLGTTGYNFSLLAVALYIICVLWGKGRGAALPSFKNGCRLGQSVG